MKKSKPGAGRSAPVTHPIPPVFDARSRVLILGSFPSVRSREEGFFYGHPQNRFWRVLAAVLEREAPQGVEEKRALLLSSGVALWDVIASCEIAGSADGSIRNVTPNDLDAVLSQAPIRAIFLNGTTAAAYYHRFFKGADHPPAFCLPSTSPANAAWTLPRLTAAWRAILDV